MRNPQAQEKYQSHLINTYEKKVPELKSKYGLKNVPDETVMMLQHYLGYGDTSLYLKTLTFNLIQ
jgi:hypothetical protein